MKTRPALCTPPKFCGWLPCTWMRLKTLFWAQRKQQASSPSRRKADETTTPSRQHCRWRTLGFYKIQRGSWSFSASDMAVAACREMFERSSVSVAELDEVITGCVMPSTEETNIARVIAVRLGCDERTPLGQFNGLCFGSSSDRQCFQDILTNAMVWFWREGPRP